MVRRLAGILIACLLLSMAAVQSFGQDAAKQSTVKLEYKFKQGELLRYQIISNININMQADTQNGGQMPTMPAKMTMVVRQRVKSIDPKGDAIINTAIESMQMEIAGAATEMPVKDLPVVAMIMTKNGVVKGYQGLDKIRGMFGGTQIMNPATFGQYGMLPIGPLKVGDTWNKDVPFAMGNTMLKSKGALLSTDSKIGDTRVVVFKQDISGDLNPPDIVASPDGKGVTPVKPTGGPIGKIVTSGTTSFSPERGQIISAEGTINAEMATNVSNAQNAGQTGKMHMKIEMTYQQTLLPSNEK